MKDSKKLAFRGGSYSLLITVVVLAILIVLNILVRALPTTLTKYDMSAAKIFSVTSNTKAVVNALDEDVNIYWVVQSGEEDKILETLLGKYQSMSSHIKVIKRNPDVFPTFAAKYTDDTVQNNSLIVECGDISRYVPIYDIYDQDVDVNTMAYNNSFDGEAAITSAINYVTTDEHPCIYRLTGHGEPALPSDFNDLITRANYDVADLSLAEEDSVPEDASCVVIFGSTRDISPEEKELLSSYVEGGGCILGFAGPTENGLLENLYSILSDYAVEMRDGVVIEEIPKYYAFQKPFIIIPHMEDTEITHALTEADYKPMMAVTAGMSVGESSRARITPLMYTSQSAFSKIEGLALKSYMKDTGDIDGPFTLGVDINVKTGGEIIWFPSSEFITNAYNAYSSGANAELAMNALASMVGEGDKLEIRSKSLNFNYLTISETQGKLLKILMIGAIPVLYLGIGISSVVETRRKQNEEIE